MHSGVEESISSEDTYGSMVGIRGFFKTFQEFLRSLWLLAPKRAPGAAGLRRSSLLGWALGGTLLLSRLTALGRKKRPCHRRGAHGRACVRRLSLASTSIWKPLAWRAIDLWRINETQASAGRCSAVPWNTSHFGTVRFRFHMFTVHSIQ